MISDNGKTAANFSALYYPFSRCIDPSSTKQMLLIFDRLNFLDPVDDESWRATLMRELEGKGAPQFQGYRAINDALPALIEEGAVVRLDPNNVKTIRSPIVTASAISDLMDASWVAVASRPDKYLMPHGQVGRSRKSTWEIFRPKIPDSFLDAITGDRHLGRHLVHGGGRDTSWLLSYEAGSAVCLAVHLATADELGLAPFSDSPMHHRLLLLKTTRNLTTNGTQKKSLPSLAIKQTAGKAAINILEDVLPRPVLERISFEDILSFRARTKLLRAQFVNELTMKLSVIPNGATLKEFADASQTLRLSLADDLRKYQAELGAVRDKLWPTLVGSMSSSIPAGGAAAVAMAYLGTMEHALYGSLVVAGLSLLKGMLDLRVDQRRTVKRAAPSVIYLSQVKNVLGR